MRQDRSIKSLFCSSSYRERRVRQGAALADVVAGKQLFDVVLQIGRLFGCHLHAAAAEHGSIQRGIQNVENGLMYDDLHM